MRKRLSILLAMLFTLSLSLGAIAASHEHDGMEKMGGMDHGKMEGMDHGKMEGMDHDKMEGMDHSGMMMEGGMIMLGDQTQDGVKAMVHLKDVQAAMAKMGMKQTHHFMVMFMNTKSGKPVTEGTVAVKIKGPAGTVSEPVKLMGMQGHFGADIVLPEKGKYEFTIGTKLPDGQKRQYEFSYEMK